VAESKLLSVLSAAVAPRGEQKALNYPDNRGGWWPVIREAATGNWQRNITLTNDQAMAFPAVFSCHTLICSDVSKLRCKLVKLQDQVWVEVTNPAYSPVLRKPNGYQTRVQFFESWMNSKLSRGNTYVLKQRDGRGVVVALYVLHPDRVQPLVSDDGQVFYKLSRDNLAGQQTDDVIVPAREIIHDRFNCLFHDLVGISPLYAALLAATQGTNIQHASSNLAANGVRPSALISYPARVPPEDASRIKETWESQYAGASGASKLAILGDGAKFEALSMTSDEAQLIEQLKFTAQMVCSAYHVPSFKVGMGELPTYANIQSLNVQYYSECIQKHLEDMEACLDEGLGMDGVTIGTEFDVDNLLRMDSLGQMEVIEKSKNVLTLDERRQRLSAPKIDGGDTVYLQQQDHSIQAIAARDAMLIDQANNPLPLLPKPANDQDPEEEAAAAAQRAAHLLRKELLPAISG
jgi:HK97 family phage portal protein